MQELSELIRVLSAKRSGSLKLFIEEQEPPDSLYLRLYNGVKDGSYTSDETAAFDLYSVEPAENRYQILKSRLKNRLYPLLFFLDIRRPKSPPLQEAEYTSLLEMVKAWILVRLGSRTLAIRLAQKTLVTAEQYGLTRIEADCLKLMRNHYAVIGSVKQYDRCNEKLHRALERLQLEYEAEELCDKLSIRFVLSTAHQPDMYNLAGTMIEKIEQIRQQCDSRKINELYFRTKNYAHQIRLEYDKAVSVSTDALKYFEEHSHSAGPALSGRFLISRAESYLHLGKYKEGKQDARDSLSYFPSGSNNWMLAHIPHFLLAMHSEDFELALLLLHSVTSHPRFQTSQSRARIALWKVFEGYVRYCLYSGWAQLATSPDLPTFRLYKMLNEVQSVSRDKSGANCSVLILEVLWLLEDRNFEQIDRLSDTLANYAKRHLRNSTSRRSLLFVRMIQVMIRTNYNTEKTRSKADRYFRQLKSLHPSMIEGAMDSLEVLPYEKLWEWMLQKLK